MKPAINDPQTRLFFSVDLVGSTAYKQSEQRWQPKFLSFYREFPQALSDSLALGIKSFRDDHFEPPHFEFWKAVGDELLYVCPVKQLPQVKVAIEAWLDAQQKYESQTLEGEKLQKTKGSVFAATFPGPDSLVAIPRNPEVGSSSDKDVVSLNEEAVQEFPDGNSISDDYLLDYLGPSMDTGFRVVSHSTAQYFTMSVEAAWAYSEACRFSGEKHDIELIEETPLKGVWEGRPYPIFAIDRMRDDPVNKALNSIHPHKCNPDQVKDICVACEHSRNWPSRLFIEEGQFSEMSSVPIDVLREPDIPGNDMEGFETKTDDALQSDDDQLTDTNNYIFKRFLDADEQENSSSQKNADHEKSHSEENDPWVIAGDNPWAVPSSSTWS